MTHEIEYLSPPKPDGRGGIAWEVDVAGHTYTIVAFLDEAYGFEAPLFEFPRVGEPLHAAHAVNAAFADWASNRGSTDAMLRAAAVFEGTERPLIPAASPATALAATAIPERSHEVVSSGPPEITDREEVRLPVRVDGIPLIAAFSMVRVPGFEGRSCHLGAIGTEDSELVSAVMRYADAFYSANRTAVDAMLAESHAKRLATGLTDDDIDPPQPPRPRVPTRAKVARLFKTPRGRLVFTATLDGAEQLIDADSSASLSGSPDPDCQNAVVYFILDNAELVAVLGLNVERWEAWR